MRFVKLAFVTVLLIGVAGTCYSQLPDASDSGLTRGRRPPESVDLKAMLAKQRTERDKRDHREMLEHGEQALKLANQLEASFTEKKSITPEDKTRLESLQQMVEKIRKELGGDDDGGDDDGGMGESTPEVKADSDDNRPSTVEEAFKYLHTTTIKLVDELKKTTRFTISAIAIQSSNNVIRLVKFLRLRK
ncbi:MAG TPA: hypothetical protein VNA22_02910 [Pyrinomonadaceae bacterium]|nr:hypothetical protein [Pyrinomonadaceae bacterium]